MGVQERRAREKSETREKILDAARELFIEHGYDAVTMRKVAERIEYSPTAIYVHFADKEELFHELCNEDFAKLAAVFQSANVPTDPIERIRAIGRLYIDFGLHYPNHYQLMFMTPHGCVELTDDDHEIRGNPERDAYAFLKLTVQQAMDDGRFRHELIDPELVSQTLWAAVHGVISLKIAKQSDAWVEWRDIQDRTDLMLDVSLRGMLREGK